ncbi:camphor resistance protein CrcB [Spongiibacter sp. IMCC21906]|jgi:CrcB protein|uniref:fluoride efflux transporter CrcB n=1 Tax=Spongiibacter sp. IMCC21906 TaxID=1620392 RepID=UPI00062DF049|nr:fluoride efflux transporter CrcB [Spongiibacter sp. IMCC21906]AKH69679.1 camphor resistance protein CrcB [Spongiibacter sp. IMCC21906]
MLLQYILVALGGATGALGRFGVSRLVAHFAPAHSWPTATFAVNLIGSTLIGILYVVITEKSSLHADSRQILMVGFLGAFTTFATFSLETVAMLEAGKALLALSYILITLASCILGCWLGIQLAR